MGGCASLGRSGHTEPKNTPASRRKSKTKPASEPTALQSTEKRPNITTNATANTSPEQTTAAQEASFTSESSSDVPGRVLLSGAMESPNTRYLFVQSPSPAINCIQGNIPDQETESKPLPVLSPSFHDSLVGAQNEEPVKPVETGALLKPFGGDIADAMIRVYFSVGDSSLVREMAALQREIIPRLLRWADHHRIGLIFVADEDTEWNLRASDPIRPVTQTTDAVTVEGLLMSRTTSFASGQSPQSVMSVASIDPLIPSAVPVGPPLMESLTWPTNPFYTRVFGCKRLRNLRLLRESHYFVALIGSRYGAVPDDQDPEVTAPGLFADFPELADMEGLSTSEVEIRLASMTPIPLCNRGFFYMKSEDQDQPDYWSSTDSRKKQPALRNLVSTKYPTFEYSSMEQLIERICEDITSKLKNDTQILEHRISGGHHSMEDFFGCNTFNQQVDREEALFQLTQSIDASIQPVLIYGPPGSGKSFMLTNYYHQLHDQGDSGIYYFSTTKHPENIYCETMMDKFRIQLTHSVMQKEILKAPGVWTFEQPDTNFFRYILLLQSQLSFSTFFVDDLGDLSSNNTNEQVFSWIPNKLSRGVKLVLVTSDVNHISIAQSRGWKVFEMPPWSMSEIQTLMMNIEPDNPWIPQVVDIMYPVCKGNPLFAQIFSVGLYLLQGKMTDRATVLSRAKNIYDLTDCVLQLILAQYESVALGFFRYLSAATTGLDESELIRQLEIPSCIYSAFLKKFGVLFRVKDRNIQFSHGFIRKVAFDVLKRKFPSDPRLNYVNLLIHRLSDISQGQAKANVYFQLAQYLASLKDSAPFLRLFRRDMFECFVNDTKKFSIILRLAYQKDASLVRKIYEMFEPHWNFDVGGIFVEAYLRVGLWKDAMSNAETHLLKSRERHADDDVKIIHACHMMASVYRLMGKYRPALSLMMEALNLQEKSSDPRDPRLALSLSLIGALQTDLGQYSRASDSFRQSLINRESALPSLHSDLADSFQGLATINIELEETILCAGHIERALSIRSELYPANHPLVLVLQTLYIGCRHASSGEESPNVLIDKFKSADWTCYRLERVVCALILSSISRTQGGHEEGKIIIADCIQSAKQWWTEDHPLLVSLEVEMCLLEFELTKDIKCCDKMVSLLSRRSKLLGYVHPHSGRLLIQLARMKNDVGKKTDAQNLIKDALPILEEAYGANSAILHNQRRWMNSLFD